MTAVLWAIAAFLAGPLALWSGCLMFRQPSPFRCPVLFFPWMFSDLGGGVIASAAARNWPETAGFAASGITALILWWWSRRKRKRSLRALGSQGARTACRDGPQHAEARPGAAPGAAGSEVMPRPPMLPPGLPGPRPPQEPRPEPKPGGKDVLFAGMDTPGAWGTVIRAFAPWSDKVGALKGCGTVAAYQRHCRYMEEIDDLCRASVLRPVRRDQ